MHQAIEASLRQRHDVGLLSLVELVQFIGAESDDPNFAIHDIDSVRTLQIGSAGDPLCLVADNLPDGVRARRLEASAGAGLQAAVGYVDCGTIAGQIVEETRPGDLDLPF